MNKDTKPLVSIRCLVYNHEPYLRQCLDGFVMQKTNFVFEAIVHDDASTDNSAAIIREYAEKYPDIIKPIYETENQFSKKDGSLRKIMNEAIHPDAKYVAFCEGDDYWTDPYKLQKQVDFMESHPNCSLTYHACKNIYEDGNHYHPYGESVEEEYKKIDLLNYPFQTATVLLKKEILFSDIYNKAIATKCFSGDMMLFLSASTLGLIKGINQQMSVYRRHSNGISVNMWEKDKLYSNYVSWVKVGKLFGKEVKKNGEETKLKSYIVSSIIGYKDFQLTFKILKYGICNSPRSIFLAFLSLLTRFINKITKIIRSKLSIYNSHKLQN